MERFSRSELLFGKENMDKLKFAHVLVVGIGGVGGYVCEVLARGGVGNLSIVDFDNVSESNINRQIIALSSTIGRPKVEVMKERIFEINPNCNVLTYNVKVNKETIGRIFDDKFDFVVDAIDDLNGKVLLAKTCQENGIKIISSMGAGNRVSIPNFKIDDLFKTHNDPLSKKFRKLADFDTNLLFLGDIVISKNVAKKQAREYGHSLKREVCFLALHGFLHLLGFDHIKKEDEKIMTKLQNKILSEVSL